MNKKIFFITLSAAIFILSAAGIYFNAKYSKAILNLKNINKEYQKSEVDYKKIIAEDERGKKENQEYKNNYIKLQKDYQALSLDRDNVLIQAKNLLAVRSRAKELEDELEKFKNEIELFKKKEKKFLQQNFIFNNKFKKLMAMQRKLVYERNQLEQFLVKERDYGGIKKLEQEKDELKQENSGLISKLKDSQMEVNRLGKFVLKNKTDLNKAIKETIQLREKLNKLNKDYFAAAKKNRALEKKIVEAPKKFVEIARQNKALIRQTADMHYNLGVFYMKNKEYQRAVAEFEKCIELTPDDAYAQFNLGYIYAEYLISRAKAIEYFRQYLRLAKGQDKDIDWVKKYILTWEAYEGKKPME